jgi:hypothetical protein
MGIVKGTKAARIQRTEDLLKYLKTRSTLVTVYCLAERFKCTTKTIQCALLPLLQENIVRLEKILHRRSVSSKAMMVNAYIMVDVQEKKERKKRDTNFWNNPFKIKHEANQTSYMHQA